MIQPHIKILPPPYLFLSHKRKEKQANKQKQQRNKTMKVNPDKGNQALPLSLRSSRCVTKSTWGKKKCGFQHGWKSKAIILN